MTHGGKRKGAGPKFKYGEPTKVMRIPVSLIPKVRKMLDKAKCFYDVDGIRIWSDPDVTYINVTFGEEMKTITYSGKINQTHSDSLPKPDVIEMTVDYTPEGVEISNVKVIDVGEDR